MQVTNAIYTDIVSILRKEIAAYNVTITEAFTTHTAEGPAVAQLQYEDMYYINSVLLDFVQNKNAKQLYNALTRQDTFVQEQYIRTLNFLKDVFEF